MNEKTIKIAVRAIRAYILKSILPTYIRFSLARSHTYVLFPCLVIFSGHQFHYELLSVCRKNAMCAEDVLVVEELE